MRGLGRRFFFFFELLQLLLVTAIHLPLSVPYTSIVVFLDDGLFTHLQKTIRGGQFQSPPTSPHCFVSEVERHR